jgi:hypothetical protein
MLSRRHVVALFVLGALAGCAQSPAAPEAKPQIEFVDLTSFDSQLAASLDRPLQRVEVQFYDRITPSQLPPRLQRWLAAVESGGGKISVNAPQSTVASKSPFLIISAITSLWSAQKFAKEASHEAALRAASRYDVELQLKEDEHGVAVTRVVFTQRRS